MSDSKKDQFKSITALQQWKDIQGLIDALDDSDYWDDDFYNTVERKAKAHHIRQMMRSYKDEDGFPQFASIETTAADGTPARIYKQVEMFEQSDFQQARSYCAGKIKHFKYLYDGYTEREKQRFGTQLSLVYQETGDRPTL